MGDAPVERTRTAGGMTACTPTETFVVGSSYEKRRWEGRNGLLWFVVNHAWNPDPGYPNMFYDDNVGFCLVQVSVTPSR